MLFSAVYWTQGKKKKIMFIQIRDMVILDRIDSKNYHCAAFSCKTRSVKDGSLCHRGHPFYRDHNTSRDGRRTTVPSHEVILLASIFVPHCEVYKTSLLLIQVEIKLLPPLGVQRFGNCLRKQQKQILRWLICYSDEICLCLYKLKETT